MEPELKPHWRRLFGFNWKFSFFLIAVICIPRFLLVLNANETANYGYIGLVMAISALVPFLFLSKSGRRTIGLTKPNKYSWLPVAFVCGLVCSLVLYLLGVLLYKDSFQNWYVYIGKSYNIPDRIESSDKLMLFGVMAATGMIFSPIGEELFFRGIVPLQLSKIIRQYQGFIC